MAYLSLFSGACGGDLACQHLLGWNCKGYVEIDDYCQRVIRQRIADGVLCDAPIFGDIQAFIDQGYADSYTGMVDVIFGGDPCQDNSAVAPRGSQSPSLGQQFLDVVRIVQPRFVLRENPAAVRKEAPWPADRFASELERMDYTAAPFEIRSCCMGADHRRARVFVPAIASDANSEPDMEAAAQILSERTGRLTRENARGETRRTKPAIPWLLSETDVFGKSDACPDRVDRGRAIGNGQDPFVVAAAWRLLGGD